MQTPRKQMEKRKKPLGEASPSSTNRAPVKRFRDQGSSTGKLVAECEDHLESASTALTDIAPQDDFEGFGKILGKDLKKYRKVRQSNATVAPNAPQARRSCLGFMSHKSDLGWTSFFESNFTSTAKLFWQKGIDDALNTQGHDFDFDTIYRSDSLSDGGQGLLRQRVNKKKGVYLIIINTTGMPGPNYEHEKWLYVGSGGRVKGGMYTRIVDEHASPGYRQWYLRSRLNAVLKTPDVIWTAFSLCEWDDGGRCLSYTLEILIAETLCQIKLRTHARLHEGIQRNQSAMHFDIAFHGVRYKGLNSMYADEFWP